MDGSSPHRSPRENDICYLPFFLSAVITSLISFGAQIGLAVLLGYQYGTQVGLAWWGGVIPHMLVVADRTSVYASIIKGSSVGASFAVVLFAVAAFVGRRRLQVKQGRTIGWLNVSTIGLVNLLSSWLFETPLEPASWMVYLSWIGFIGFCVCTWLIHETRSGRRRDDAVAPGSVGAV